MAFRFVEKYGIFIIKIPQKEYVLMTTYHFSNEQARNFVLKKQGLLGDYGFSGKQGALDFVRQAGCIQYDPIDVCGKNPELVLQSRVSGFSKNMLTELLYQDRSLVDYFDKNMAIICTQDWKYFARTRRHFSDGGHSREVVDAAAGPVVALIRQRGVVCSRDIASGDKVDWAWGPTSLPRAVLETLYFRGELVLHHKKGAMKYYALASSALGDGILSAKDPNVTEADFVKWMVARRIGSVGLLWNKPSDAWLGIRGINAEKRNEAFEALLSDDQIIQCQIDGIPETVYFLKQDESLAQAAVNVDKHKKRLEFIAPLDNMMWDRRLTKALFGFEYKWEIYTPVVERKYGYYVLPVLYGNQFAGRIEMVTDKKAKQLVVKNYWPESGFKQDKRFEEKLEKRLQSFAAFNNCDDVKTECCDIL